MSAFQEPGAAKKYLDFLNSNNGRIQQKILLESIFERLSSNRDITILDAGCGPGWLAFELKKEYKNVEACDASTFFIDFAKGKYAKINFKIADLANDLPYPAQNFDIAIFNMAAPDLENLNVAFKNLANAIKPSGKLILTVPNPKYTYPAAVWKRSLLDVLFGKKPGLKIKTAPASGSKIEREFGQSKISSYYYLTESYIAAAKNARLSLAANLEIKSFEDSPNFDLNYQMYRYPLILLLEFVKN